MLSTSVRYARSSNILMMSIRWSDAERSRVALNHDHAGLQGRSPAAVQSLDAAPITRSETPQAEAFLFLSAVDDDAIAHRIKDEHPQTLAIILSSISPRQAARLLAKLNAASRAETMRRLAKMDAPPIEVALEIAAQLKEKLVHANGTGWTAAGPGDPHPSMAAAGSDRRTVGQAALQAILAEMNQASQVTPMLSTAGVTTPLDDAIRSKATVTGPAIAADSIQSSLGTASRADVKPIRPTRSAAEVHAQLIALSPSQLRQALASVDGRQAILALCGLPKAIADAVLSDLPRRQAKLIRSRMTSLGMLELKEIDAAKLAVAQVVGGATNRASTPPATTTTSALTSTLAAA
jgi:flagellar motor switch protein FliG